MKKSEKRRQEIKREIKWEIEQEIKQELNQELKQKIKREMEQEAKQKEVLALQGVAAGIGNRLHVIMPNSQWRWVCYPAGFTLNGGIARIEVVCSAGSQRLVDVCLAQNGYMALHLVNAVELTVSAGVSDSANVVDEVVTAEAPTSTTAPIAATAAWSQESVGKWYNIVLINTLTALIGDLNAKGGLYLNIGQDGKVYTQECGSDDIGSIAILYDFGEMPDVTLWGHITEKLGEAGLFAEVQDENRLFVSWA